MDHSYLNVPAVFPVVENNADVPDIDFLTDASIYYNLPPPPPPSVHGRGGGLSSTRGGSGSQKTPTLSNSCPSSPKLPPSGGVSQRRGQTSSGGRCSLVSHGGERQGNGGCYSLPRGKGPPLPLVPTEVTSGAEYSPAEVSSPSFRHSPTTTPLPPPSVKERNLKSKTKKLSQTRSFDLDHIYQNLVRVASKPRSNSFSVPWKKKKKAEASFATVPNSGSTNKREVATTTSAAIPPESALNDYVGIREAVDLDQCEPKGVNDVTPLTRNRRPSVHSSHSSNSSDSESGSDEGEDYIAAICPGVTYLKETPTKKHGAEVNTSEGLPECTSYHTTATLPLRSSRGVRKGEGNSFSPSDGAQKEPLRDVAASLEEWRRKERWLEKKRSSRNLRQTGESGEVHVVILYAQDGVAWKDYLYELFTQMVPKDEGYQAVRVEVKNVEEIEEYVGGLQAFKVKSARLQIVIISPRFMAHIAGHGRSEIGQLFEPEKVLGLLLGVNDSQFSMAHLSALYSYKDWHRLEVRNSDLKFVEEVLSEAIKILNNNKLYLDCPDERSAKFKVTSRKITMAQKQIYILLNNEVSKSDVVEVRIEAPSRIPVLIQKHHLLNPYTIWFSMPEDFLKKSTLLQLTVLVNGKDMGSRQLKCESHMDTLRDILASVSNPTELMCQAMNINPICEDLDQKLSEKVKQRLPLTKLEDPVSRRDGAEFPTWIHFSAFYGLERLTWALMEIPGAEQALSTLNCYGNTPSVLAYQKGFYSLAQKLENVALVASLATKVCSYPGAEGDPELFRDVADSSKTHNNRLPPRPINNNSSIPVLPNYDPLPAPRSVSTSTSSLGITASPTTHCTSIPNEYSEDPNILRSNKNSSLLHSSLDNASSIPVSSVPIRQKTVGEKHTNSYIDMNVSPADRHGKLYEYREEVYTLVEAWNQKTDMKAFVEGNQTEIDKMKWRLDASQRQGINSKNGNSSDYASLPSVPHASNRISDDPLQQKTMVDKFISLLQDSYSEGSEKQNKNCCQNGNNLNENSCDLPGDSSPSYESIKREDKNCQSPICDNTPITPENRPRAAVPRPKSEMYLSPDQLNTPKQFEIFVEMKKLREEELMMQEKSFMDKSQSKR